MALGDSTTSIHKVPSRIYNDSTMETPSNYIRLANSVGATVDWQDTPYIEHAFHDGHVTVSFWLRCTNTTMSFTIVWSLNAYVDQSKTNTMTVSSGRYSVSKFTSSNQSARQIILDIAVPETLTYIDENFNQVETVLDPNLLANFNVSDKVGSGSLYFRTDRDTYADAWYFLPTAPAVPAVTANPASLASGQSVLRWPRSADGVNNPLTAYKVYRRTYKAPVTWKLMDGGTLEPDATSFVVDSCDVRDKWYEFCV